MDRAAPDSRPLALVRPPWQARAAALARETILPTLRSGSIPAGNIAYLSIVTLFPLVILITAATNMFGRTDAGQAAIAGLMAALPDQAARLLRPVIVEVLTERTGNLLWVGGLVGLWTVTGFVETIREVFHRAYDQEPSRPFWVYRLISIGATILAMFLLLAGFVSQLLLQVVFRNLRHFLPYTLTLPPWIDASRLLPPVMIFGALWAIYKLLAPTGRPVHHGGVGGCRAADGPHPVGVRRHGAHLWRVVGGDGDDAVLLYRRDGAGDGGPAQRGAGQFPPPHLNGMDNDGF